TCLRFSLLPTVTGWISNAGRAHHAPTARLCQAASPIRMLGILAEIRGCRLQADDRRGLSMRGCVGIGLIVFACFAGALYAQTAVLPLWAYGYIMPPASPADYSTRCTGDRPSDCDRPGGLPTDPQNTPRRLEGSDGVFTVAQVNYRYGPADWFPN